MSNRRTLLTITLWLAIVLIATPLQAQDFATLPTDIRTTLEPFKGQWSDFDSGKQQKLINGA